MYDKGHGPMNNIRSKSYPPRPSIFCQGLSAPSLTLSSPTMMGNDNQLRQFDSSIVHPSINNFMHPQSVNPLIINSTRSSTSRIKYGVDATSPEDSPDSDVTCVTSDGSCDSRSDEGRSTPERSAKISNSGFYSSWPHYKSDVPPVSCSLDVMCSSNRVYAVKVPKPEPSVPSDSPNHPSWMKLNSGISTVNQKSDVCKLSYGTTLQLSREDVNKTLVQVIDRGNCVDNCHQSQPPNVSSNYRQRNSSSGNLIRVTKPEPFQLAGNPVNYGFSKKNDHSMSYGVPREVSFFDLNEVSTSISNKDNMVNEACCNINQDSNRCNIGKEFGYNQIQESSPSLRIDYSRKAPGLYLDQSNKYLVRRSDSTTTPRFNLNHADTSLDNKEDYCKAIVPVCSANLKDEPCRAIVPVDEFPCDNACHSERTDDTHVECSSSGAIVPYENEQSNYAYNSQTQINQDIGQPEVKNQNVAYTSGDGVSGAPSRPRPCLLPTVGAFAVQCSLCMKWRLVPSKQLYEQIRQSIIERPFYCTTASLWRPGASCIDPPDLSEDKKCIWAIDKPNIPAAPDGWQRLLVIRGAGASKFADIYYVAPNGKKLRSMPDVEKFLLEYPEYLRSGLTLDQFSFVIPRSLDENYCRRKTPPPASTASSLMRGSMSQKKAVNNQLKTKYQTHKRSSSGRVKSSVNSQNYEDSLDLCNASSTQMPIAAQPLSSGYPVPFWSSSSIVPSQSGLLPWSLPWMN